MPTDSRISGSYGIRFPLVFDDPTLDPSLESWVPVPSGSDFTVQNLPYGVFSIARGSERVGVAIGDHILDLAKVSADGSLPGVDPKVFGSSSLNPFLGLGRPAWRAVRQRVSNLLTSGEAAGRIDPCLIPQSDVTMHCPVDVGDYVDFYSSLDHALNVGRIFRPEGEPLEPNWRYMPVGYHGRAGTVDVSSTPVRRPCGVVRSSLGPVYQQSERLDFELEVGFVTGPGKGIGVPIPVEEAEEHIFGICLLNDWSARDIQAFEYRPLGPFLGKSFQTSISPWIVDLDALAPFRVKPPLQEPLPSEHLQVSGPFALDLRLEALLNGSRVALSNFRDMYWTMAQQLAHATSNGAKVRPGDLWGSGTVSGSVPGSYGCLLEATRDGETPIPLDDGTARVFLEDGDEVILRGWCESPGRPRVGLGECRGKVLGARRNSGGPSGSRREV